MKINLSSSSRRLSSVLALTSLLAAPSVVHGAQASPAFELPRIKSNRQRGDVPRLALSKYDVDDLQPQGTAGARRATNAGQDHLALDAGKDLTRTLRGSPNDVVYVSFLLTGSDGTTLEVAGAKITVTTTGLTKSAKVLLGDSPSPGGSARDVGRLIGLEKFSGSPLASLPLLTLRIDPAAKTWDAYLFDQIVGSDIPLGQVGGGASKKLTLHAGSQGALLSGLIISDENPLFLDANGNGIDDRFEKQANGSLLAANAPSTARSTLLSQWKTEQAKTPTKAWAVRRPLPDK